MKREKNIQEEILLSHTPSIEREWIKQDKIIYAALTGAGLLLVQPFLYEGQAKSLSAMVTVIAFSIAIPILAALLLLNEEESFRKHLSQSRIVAFTRAIGQAAAFVGFIAAFWHVNSVAGICALGASVVGMSAHSAGYMKLYFSKRKANK